MEEDEPERAIKCAIQALKTTTDLLHAIVMETRQNDTLFTPHF